MRRALVIGLDGASPALVLDRWLDELPSLRALVARASFGVLRSCDPPNTIPAWACLASSRSPGALGLYGFRNRRHRSSPELAFATSRDVHVPLLWDVLSERGRPVVVVGVPPSYPPTPVRGAMVSCFLAPGVVTFPSGLRAELDGYEVDVPGYRAASPKRLLAALHSMLERRFDVVERLATTRPWDLLFLVEIGTDRLHHRFWHDEETMLAYYRRLDRRIGALVALAGDETAVLVVSDHGAQESTGAVYLNEWLRRQGLLVLRDEPRSPTPLRPQLVDWRATTAWGEGGHYGRVFLNVRGRESTGFVAPTAFESVRGDLKRRLEALGDGTVAHRPEDLYAVRTGIPPDLLVYFDGLRRRSLGDVGVGCVEGPAPDAAGHALEGLYLVAADGIERGRGPERSLLDVAPTVLDLLGERVPEEMEGVSMVGAP